MPPPPFPQWGRQPEHWAGPGLPPPGWDTPPDEPIQTPLREPAELPHSCGLCAPRVMFEDKPTVPIPFGPLWTPRWAGDWESEQRTGWRGRWKRLPVCSRRLILAAGYLLASWGVVAVLLLWR